LRLDGEALTLCSAPVRRSDPDNALWRHVESPLFAAVIMAAIVGNAIVLGLQTYDGVVAEHDRTLDWLNDVFLAIFVVELTLRIAAYGRRPQDFFRSSAVAASRSRAGTRTGRSRPRR